MKSKVALTMLCVGLLAPLLHTQPAEAKKKRNSLERFGHDLDKARRKTTDVAIDIATLGHTKREREREEAKAAQQQAEMQRAHAQQMQQRKISDLNLQILTAKDRVALVEKTIFNYTLLESGIEGNLQLVKILLENAKVDKIKAEQIKQLVVEQNAGMAERLSYDAAADPEVSAQTQALLQVLAAYKEQLQFFPIDSSSQEELDALSGDLLQQTVEILIIVQKNKEIMQRHLEQAKRDVANFQESLTELSK